MTKKQIIEAMADLDDDAIIYVHVPEESAEGVTYIPEYYCDKVTGDKVQNEITFVCN